MLQGPGRNVAPGQERSRPFRECYHGSALLKTYRPVSDDFAFWHVSNPFRIQSGTTRAQPASQPGPRPTGAACQGLGGPQSMVRPCLPAGRRRVATAKMMTSGATSSCTWASVRAGFAMLAGMLAILQVMGCWPRSFDGRHLFERGSAGLARLVRGCPSTCTRWRLAAQPI